MKPIYTLLCTMFVLTACSQGPAPADPSAITAQSDAWQTALNAGDLDTLVTIYTSDARMLPPNGVIARGSDAVRAEFSGMIEANIRPTLTVVEAKVSGDIGYIVGTFMMRIDGKVVDAGKYIETWRREQDGQWRISNDIYNSDGQIETAKKPDSHLLITHEVDDPALWLTAWRGDDGRRKLFREHGANHVHTFQNADNPNLTGLVISVSDMDALQSMLASKEGLAAAAEDGVRANTMLVLQDAH